MRKRLITYKEVVLADRPDAYWPMDDAGSVVRDISGNGVNATYTNNANRLARGVARNGGGRGFSLAGSAYFAWPANAQTAVNNFSRECWINTVSATNQFLLANYHAGDGEDFWKLLSNDTWWIFFYSHGFIYTSNDGGVGGVPVWRQNMHDGRWHHLVYISRNAGRARIYVDGRQEVDMSAGTTAELLTTAANSGYTAQQGVDNTNFFNGIMSDAAIYGYVLSPDQILRHYQAGRLGRSI